MIFTLSFISFLIGFLYGKVAKNDDEYPQYDTMGIHDDKAASYIGELLSVVKRYIPSYKLKMGSMDFLKYGRFINPEDIDQFDGTIYVPDLEDYFQIPYERMN